MPKFLRISSLIFFFLFSTFGFSQSAATDREALIALYNATDGPNWTNTWDLDTDMSTWYGITLDGDGRVESIILNINNLSGNIPPEIGNLLKLKQISLFNNQLSGSIPPELENLSELIEMDFTYNNLSGSIPNFIGHLSNLEILHLGYNNLDGVLPPEIGNLQKIKSILIGNNNLSGEIPKEFGNLSTLTRLWLFGNELTGRIPAELGNLANLEDLTLENNNLVGLIPAELGNLINLKSLKLGANQLTGSIPSSFSNLTKLEYFHLYSNLLSGEIPSFIGSIASLYSIALAENNFSGNFPTTIWTLQKLKTLNINDCPNLSNWSIPSDIQNLVNLEEINAENTNLFGDIPDSFDSLTKLSFLNFSKNNITGNIPTSLLQNSSILNLLLSNNKLSGSLPPTISESLNTLTIHYNNFVFEDLTSIYNEYQYNLNLFSYTPQNKIGEKTTITLSEGERFEITVEGTDHPNNTYQWLSGSSPEPEDNIVGETENNFVIENVTSDDQLIYRSYIENPDVPSLKLYTNDITLVVYEADDDDGDGVPNDVDNCPNTPDGESVDVNGCSESQSDNDNDGVMNDMDICPNTPDGEAVNESGCSDSQLSRDDDNDGVPNDMDNCPDTPVGESVDTNGCSESQLDDDNDGVPNDMDNCPDTSDGKTVDANGCSDSQLDDDNDGVMNDADNCPNTPDGETVDANGCADSQLDDDNDGVMNDVDNCPDTPIGTSVNADGCASTPDIANSGIQVRATSVSCPDKANGEITVSFDADYTYTVTISSNQINETYININSTSGLAVSELPTGDYTVCITIPEFPNFEQCFVISIKTPDELKSGKVTVDNDKKSGKVVVSGSKNYEVLVNGKRLHYSFDSTGPREISFGLIEGANAIVVKTDKNCQGEYAETVMLNSVRVYPNPSSDVVTISGLINGNNAKVSIFDMSGTLVRSYVKNIANTSTQINISDIQEGVYTVRILSDEQDVQTKIVKK